jgi:hypothetical protein
MVSIFRVCPNKLWFLGFSALFLTSCGGAASPARQTDLGGLFPPVIVSVSHTDEWTVSFSATQPLEDATFYFDNGGAETHDLSGLIQVVHCENVGQMTYLKASTRGGDYWYFDNAGLWLPYGYKPKFWSRLEKEKSPSSVWVGGNQLGVTCSDTYSQVKVYFEDDSFQTFDTSATSGTYDLYIASENVAAIRIILQGDGSRYYYKADGTELPLGTKWYEDAD